MLEEEGELTRKRQGRKEDFWEDGKDPYTLIVVVVTFVYKFVKMY